MLRNSTDAVAHRAADKEIVRIGDHTTVLDLEQLRNVTLDDQEMMREIIAALIEDTERQLLSLGQAIQDCDSNRTARLAHYSKGACANVGARASAHLLHSIERLAANRDFSGCSASLTALAHELDHLRAEAACL